MSCVLNSFSLYIYPKVLGVILRMCLVLAGMLTERHTN